MVIDHEPQHANSHRPNDVGFFKSAAPDEYEEPLITRDDLETWERDQRGEIYGRHPGKSSSARFVFEVVEMRMRCP